MAERLTRAIEGLNVHGVSERITVSYGVSEFPTAAQDAPGLPENDDWVTMLARDLREAWIKTVLDRRDNAAIGLSISRFISRIETSDFIVVIGTPLYLKKYQNKISAMGSVAAAEVDLIDGRLLGAEEEKNSVLPLLREGEPKSALVAAK